MRRPGVVLGKGPSVAADKGEWKRRFFTETGHHGWGQDSADHNLPLTFPSAPRVTPGSLEGPGCLCPRGRISLPGEDGTGDAQQQHPRDPASALGWAPASSRVRGHGAAFTLACSEGQTGRSLLQVGDPPVGRSSTVVRVAIRRWAAVSPEVPAPGAGGRPWPGA